MKRLLFFSSIWMVLSIQGVYALYRETFTSTRNVFSVSSTSLTPTSSTTITPAINHIVINEVQIKGASASQDFIELYNPTSVLVDMSGWKIRKRISTGTESSLIVIPAGTIIDPHRYLLWANTTNSYNTSIGADISNSGSLADNNSIALLSSSDTIVDQLSWGPGTNQFKEGLGYPDNPGASQSIERKPGIDTDHNETDFTLSLVSHPQNKLSPPD